MLALKQPYSLFKLTKLFRNRSFREYNEHKCLSNYPFLANPKNSEKIENKVEEMNRVVSEVKERKRRRKRFHEYLYNYTMSVSTFSFFSISSFFFYDGRYSPKSKERTTR